MPAPIRVLALTVTLAATALAAPGAQAAPSAATDAFSRSFTDTCTVLSRSYPVPAVVSGRIPPSVARGESFPLSQLVFRATIPAELATFAYRTGARTARLTLRVVNARSRGVLPEVQDVIGTDVVSGPLPVRPSEPLPFRAPATGSLPAVTFTAGDTAGTALLRAGKVRASIALYDAQGKVIVAAEPVTCAAPSPAITVTTIQVT